VDRNLSVMKMLAMPYITGSKSGMQCSFIVDSVKALEDHPAKM